MAVWVVAVRGLATAVGAWAGTIVALAVTAPGAPLGSTFSLLRYPAFFLLPALLAFLVDPALWFGRFPVLSSRDALWTLVVGLIATVISLALVPVKFISFLAYGILPPMAVGVANLASGVRKLKAPATAQFGKQGKSLS